MKRNIGKCTGKYCDFCVCAKGCKYKLPWAKEKTDFRWGSQVKCGCKYRGGFDILVSVLFFAFQ